MPLDEPEEPLPTEEFQVIEDEDDLMEEDLDFEYL